MKLFVMRIVDRPAELVGQYLRSFDFDAFDGQGHGEFTHRVEEAMHFLDAAHALSFWRTVSTVKPLRPDGEPNRPLTGYHVLIEKVSP